MFCFLSFTVPCQGWTASWPRWRRLRSRHLLNWLRCGEHRLAVLWRHFCNASLIIENYMTIDAIIFCMQIDGSCEWTFHSGEKLRELLYKMICVWRRSMLRSNGRTSRTKVCKTCLAYTYKGHPWHPHICQENSDTTLGGWKTEAQLALEPGWTAFET